MLRIYSGENRMAATKEIEKILGTEYEVIDGMEMAPEDMPSVFRGNTLFGTTRNILIRDISANKPVYEKLPEYIDTTHNIVILELKLDKRSSVYKTIKDKVECREFVLPKDPNMGLVFDIYRTAKRDGVAAVKMLDKVKDGEDPIMLCGLIISQALKDYRAHPGVKEKRVLRELSKLDLAMKSTSWQPWTLLQAFLLRMSSL